MKIKISFSIKHIELLQERNGIAFNNPECSAIENSFCSQVQSLSRDKIGFWLSEEMANREKVLFVFSLLKKRHRIQREKKCAFHVWRVWFRINRVNRKNLLHIGAYYCSMRGKKKKLLCTKIDFKPNIG